MQLRWLQYSFKVHVVVISSLWSVEMPSIPAYGRFTQDTYVKKYLLRMTLSTSVRTRSRVARINHFSTQNLKPINWCSHLQLIRKQAREGAHIAINPRPWQDHHQQQTKQSWSFPNSSFCWLFAASRFLDWWRQLDSMQLQNLGFLSRRLNFHQIFQVRFQEEVPKGVELQLFPMKFSI